MIFGHFFPQTGIFLFFIPAVMVSAWYGGRGPGILATLTGAVVVNYFFLNPTDAFDFDASDYARLIAFLLVGLQISVLSGALLSAKRRAEADAQALRQSEELYRVLAQLSEWGRVFGRSPASFCLGRGQCPGSLWVGL